MKRWGLVVFAIIAISILLFTQVAATQGQCDAADALRDAKFYEDAIAGYKDLLKNDSSRECAQVGIQNLSHNRAKELFDTGQVYEKAGQMDKANEAYVEALKIDPNLAVALEALDSVKQARNLFDRGQAYENASRMVDAKNAYVEALKINPNLKEAQDALDRMDGKILNFIYPFLVALAIIILIWILKINIFPLFFGILSPSLDIKEFDKGASGLEIGKVMTAMFEENLKSFKNENHFHPPFTLVIEPMGKVEIPVEIKASSPPIQYLSQLIDWLIPPNVITLYGLLEKPGAKGAGLTLTLVKSLTGEIIGCQTVWEKDFYPEKMNKQEDNDHDIYYRLIVPAATWTYFQLNTSSKVKGTYRILADYIPYLSRHSKIFKILNTQDWISYAYFRSGIRYRNDNNIGMEKKMYCIALDRDPDNVGALNNLGLIEQNNKNYDLAEQRFKRIKELINPKDSEVGFVWFTASYHITAGYNTRSHKETDAKKINESARDEAEKIIKEIKEIKEVKLINKLIRLFNKYINKKEYMKNLHYLKTLDTYEPKIKILYAVILSYLDSSKEAEEQINGITSEGLSSRTKYNLACYYSLAGKEKDAFTNLEYAFEANADLVESSLKDPDLDSVRKENKEYFDKLILKYAPKETLESSDLLPLSGITIIGKTFALKLKTKGIVKHCHLICKAGTDSARIKLGEDLDISTKLLEKWALLSDMTRIDGITPYLNLLDEADIDSLRDLKQSEPCDLAALLTQLNEAHSIVKLPPSEDTIRNWVDKAKIITPKVS